MPFADAERAVVTEGKVRDYLLNPNHPVGGPKAAWLSSIGYCSGNWRDLVDDLRMLAQSVDEFVAKRSRFGVKYEVAGRIGRPGHRPADVITVWIVEGNSSPRLIIAFPG
jgi:hypothetical protein